jgi:hypothetical protein
MVSVADSRIVQYDWIDRLGDKCPLEKLDDDMSIEQTMVVK